MQITITPSQATKARIAIKALYEGKIDPEIEELLSNLAEVIESRPQEAYCACGALIPIDPTGRPKAYCSDRCRQQAYRERVNTRKRTFSYTNRK